MIYMSISQVEYMADAEVQKVKDAVSMVIGRKVNSSQARLILEKIAAPVIGAESDEVPDSFRDDSKRKVSSDAFSQDEQVDFDDEMPEASGKVEIRRKIPVPLPDVRRKVIQDSQVRLPRMMEEKINENSIERRCQETSSFKASDELVDKRFSSGQYKPSPSERMKAIEVIRKIDGQIAFLQRKKLDLMQLYRIIIEDDEPKKSRFGFRNDDEDNLP